MHSVLRLSGFHGFCTLPFDKAYPWNVSVNPTETNVSVGSTILHSTTTLLWHDLQLFAGGSTWCDSTVTLSSVASNVHPVGRGHEHDVNSEWIKKIKDTCVLNYPIDSHGGSFNITLSLLKVTWQWGHELLTAFKNITDKRFQKVYWFTLSLNMGS